MRSCAHKDVQISKDAPKGQPLNIGTKRSALPVRACWL